MTIKEVEEKVGIKKANIRYYEEMGLIRPARDQGNNYRVYSEEDVELLKKIRFLRSIDISVEEIRLLEEGKIPMDRLMDQQIETAEEICRFLRRENPSFQTLDPSFAQAEYVWREKGGVVMKTDRIREISKLQEKDKKILDFIEVVSSLCLGIMIILVSQGARFPIWLTLTVAAVMIGAHAARYRISKQINRLRK